MKYGKIIKGNLIIEEDDKNDYSQIEEITGNLYINFNAKLDSLQTVGGNLYINSNAKLEANNLQAVGGYLYINSNAKLEANNLQAVGGNLYINSNAKLDSLQTVGGNLYINSNAKLEANNLQAVGGNLYINSNAKLEANNLQAVGGYLSINSNAKLEANPNIKYNVKKAKKIASDFTFNCFLNLGFLWVDNILSRIISKKKNVYKIQIIGKTKISYCIEVDGIYSHGETLKQAKESLIYKISNRDTSMYKDYTLDTVVTFEEAVKMYRCITGACEQGTKYFCTTGLKRKKSKYTIKEIIELTKNQYGHETFKEFFEVNNGR